MSPNFVKPVMNTTPTIINTAFSDSPFSQAMDKHYTVIGNHTTLGYEEKPEHSITLVILPRGGKFQRSEFFERLLKMGWAEIISIEYEGAIFDYEQLTAKFSRLRFLVFPKPTINPGFAINCAIRETRTQFAYVLWSSMNPVALSPKLFLEITQRAKNLVSIPIIRGSKGEVLPTISIPVQYQQGLKAMYSMPGGEYKKSLFPFDYVGIYRKSLFQLIEGFDPLMTSPYWQRFDFGLRAYLWGYTLPVCMGLKLDQSQDFEVEDLSPDVNYLRFYLKNLAVEFRQDHGVLDKKIFWKIARKSGQGFFTTRKIFTEIRNWVDTHSFRFTQDAKMIVELWDEEDSFS
jgi:hypothetical protein